MTETDERTETGRPTSESMPFDHDVVIVGGSASGLAAGVFTARHGLDTLVLRGGHTALLRCSVLENYLGLPNVDPADFLEVASEQARDAGCRVENRRVEQLSRAGAGFAVEAGGETITSRRVVAASGPENDYLQEIADGALYRGPATHDNLEYYVPCDDAGRTAVDGLYAAGRLSGVEHQVLIAAGNGARVGLAVVRDSLRDAGLWDELADQYHDWAVHPHRHDGWEIDDWLRERVPDDVDPDDDAVAERLSSYRERLETRTRTEDQKARRLERGRALLERYHRD